MAAVHGRKVRVLVDGFDLSRFFKTANIERDAELVDTTTFQASSKTYLVGYIDGKVSLNGLFSSNADAPNPNEADDVLAPLLGNASTEPLIVIAPEDMDAVGKRCSLLQARETKYSVMSPSNGVVSIMSEMQSDGGIRSGVCLHPLTPARTASGSAASVDAGPASQNGAVAQLHVVGAMASSSLTVIVEDSADGATGWATIAAFAPATNVGAARQLLAGAIRRFCRVSYTISGVSASFTFSVALARL